MFESIPLAPPDPILGLTEAFKKDPNPNKINLGVGVYQDAAGKTPILESVRQAEAALLEREQSKSYLPIDGSPQYASAVQLLMFGNHHEIVLDRRAATAHTPGGTGALRVAAEYLKKMHPQTTIWLSDPTWANHPNIFKAAGLNVKTYPYFDAPNNRVDLNAMLAALDQIPAGDVVLLHGCCHNPTGADLSTDQWAKVASVVSKRKLLPLVDFAYQGFALGLDEDAAGLLQLCQPGCELLIASSFSKNFGLYNERVGALTVVAANRAAAAAVMSHVKTVVRTNYSNPPAHGAAIVAAILNDPKLRALWLDELAQMRDRINGMRKLFVEKLAANGVTRDFSFLTRQAGMFSFTGLSQEQVQTLRDKHGIYMVGGGRVNVAGITPANADPLCQAIAAIL